MTDELCGPGTLCVPGDICLQLNSNPPIVDTCAKFCDTDADCAAVGGLCVHRVPDGTGGVLMNVQACSVGCDLLTGAGCVANAACYLGIDSAEQRPYAVCAGGVGAGTQGSPCATPTDCAAGFNCFGSSCQRWCDVAAPNCGGLTCSPSTIDGVPIVIGNITYGSCG